MSLSLMVRIGYREASGKASRQTHLFLQVDDRAPLSEIPRTVARAVEEWGREFGYIPFEWELKTAFLGPLDLFRGKVRAREISRPEALPQPF